MSWASCWGVVFKVVFKLLAMNTKVEPLDVTSHRQMDKSQSSNDPTTVTNVIPPYTELERLERNQ